MVTRRTRNHWFDYTATVIAVAITIALLVGWVLVVVFYTGAIWLLVLGIIGLVGVGVVLGVLAVRLGLTAREVRRQGVFLDAMTHELKSPLASLKACAETLERPDLGPGQQRELIEMMGQDIDRLANLIDDVLVAGRLADEGFGTTSNEVPLREPVSRAIARVRRRHGVPAESITAEIDADCRIMGDPPAIDTVLGNLIDNAVKYSDPPVRVRIVGTALGDEVLLTVSDAGIGIDPRDQRRILRRFTRGDTDAVRARHGTGLGLTVAAALVRRSRGRLHIDSPGVGHGTVISVRWPRAVGSDRGSAL